MTIRTQGILVTVAFVVFLLVLAATTARGEVVRVDNSTFSEDPACNPDPDDFQIRMGVGNSSGIFTPGNGDGLRIPPDAPCAMLGKKWDWQVLRRRTTSHPDVSIPAARAGLHPLSDEFFAGPDGFYDSQQGGDDGAISYSGHWVWEHIAQESVPTPPPWVVKGAYQVTLPVVPGSGAPPNNHGVRYGYGPEHGVNSVAHRPDPRGNYRGPVLLELDQPYDAVQIVVERPCHDLTDPSGCKGMFVTSRALFWDATYTEIGFRRVRHDIGDPRLETLTYMDDAGGQISSFQWDSPAGQTTVIRHVRVGTATLDTVIPDREIVWSRAEQHPDIDGDLCYGYSNKYCPRTTYPTFYFDTFSDPSIHLDRNANGLHAGGCAMVRVDPCIEGDPDSCAWEERCHPIYDAQGFQVAELDPLDDLIPVGSPAMCVEPWPGDLDGDGCTGGPDFALFVTYFGTCRP